jgi:antitoxin VapB
MRVRCAKQSSIAQDWIASSLALLAMTETAGGLRTMSERRVKLFRDGRHQAIRIPREFELLGENAIIRKEGKRLIIEAAPRKSLPAVLATLQPLGEDFPLIEDPPVEAVRLPD